MLEVCAQWIRVASGQACEVSGHCDGWGAIISASRPPLVMKGSPQSYPCSSFPVAREKFFRVITARMNELIGRSEGFESLPAFERLEAVKADVNSASVIFQRIAEGEELPKIAKAWGLPKGAFAHWYSTVHGDLYDAARKVREADLAMEMLETARGSSAETAQVDKLKIDTLKWLMSKWDRARYGESVKVEKSVTFGVDEALLGSAGDLLKLVKARREKVVEDAEII